MCSSPGSNSRKTVRRFGAPRRIGFPLSATGAAPIVLLGAKPAILATIHAEPLDVLADETLDELEVVPPVRRSGKQLRLQQLVEPEQRRIARQLVLDELRRRFGALVGEDLVEQRRQRVERRILIFVVAQHAYTLRDVAD